MASKRKKRKLARTRDCTSIYKARRAYTATDSVSTDAPVFDKSRARHSRMHALAAPESMSWTTTWATLRRTDPFLERGVVGMLIGDVLGLPLMEWSAARPPPPPASPPHPPAPPPPLPRPSTPMDATTREQNTSNLLSVGKATICAAATISTYCSTTASCAVPLWATNEARRRRQRDGEFDSRTPQGLSCMCSHVSIKQSFARSALSQP